MVKYGNKWIENIKYHVTNMMLNILNKINIDNNY